MLEEDISAIPDNPVASLQPVAFLDSRMVKKGASVLSQIKVQWAGISDSLVTWEEASDLRRRFPTCAAWGQAAFQGGGNVRISKHQLRKTTTLGVRQQLPRRQVILLALLARLLVAKLGKLRRLPNVCHGVSGLRYIKPCNRL
jgi:hypothetical protein